MTNKSVVSSGSDKDILPMSLSGGTWIAILTIALLVVVGLLPRLMNRGEVTMVNNEPSLYANPELKVLDYPTIAALVPDLHDNPELKVLNYAVTDRATSQIDSDGPARAFPEAMGNEQHANPELKYLRYSVPSVSNTIDLYTNPELKTLAYYKNK